MNKSLFTTKNFLLESGKSIPDLKIAYHTYGKLNEDKSNVIWVFHAFSANSDVLGWWDGLFGDNRIFNPQVHFIICANAITSPYGSTMPEDLAFPLVTVRDVVQAQILLAEALDITRIKVAIGGSFGGNQALEFAHSFKGQLENLILVASAARESAYSIATHEAQRLALQADPTFGQKDGGKAGLKAARGMAMLTYRTYESYLTKQTDFEPITDNYKAASYINYQGDKFVARFNALSYYYLSKCMDTHNIGRGRGGERTAMSTIKANTLVIGIDTDRMIPTSNQKVLADAIPNAQYREITSKYGHDGFLIEGEQLTMVIADFLLGIVFGFNISLE